MKNVVQEINNNFVVNPVDKIDDDAPLVLKQFYFERLLKEFGIMETLLNTNIET